MPARYVPAGSMRLALVRARRYAVALAAVAFAGVATLAGVAHGDDRATTAALLGELDHDVAHKAAIGAPLQRAHEALERATRMRAAGDEAHAQLADGLARELAETARDLVRALEAERMANDARRAATDAGTVGDRERALLEEGIARNGRLRTEIEELGRPRQKEARTSSLAMSDAGAPAPAPAPAAAKGDGGAR